MLLAAAAVVLVLAAFLVPTLGDDDDQAGTEGTTATTAADAGPGQPDDAATDAPDETTDAPDETTDTDEDAPDATETTPTPTTTTTAPAGVLPAGWDSFPDPQGAYTIGLPPGWEVDRTDNSNRIDLRDPATGSFLRIEWVAPPNGDPVGVWQADAVGMSSRLSGYEELGIAPVAYRDYDAALWEFRHGSGPVLHTGNLGFVANGRGYALMLRTPEDQWAASQPLFEQFKQAFQPT